MRLIDLTRHANEACLSLAAGDVHHDALDDVCGLTVDAVGLGDTALSGVYLGESPKAVGEQEAAAGGRGAGDSGRRVPKCLSGIATRSVSICQRGLGLGEESLHLASLCSSHSLFQIVDCLLWLAALRAHNPTAAVD
jgi:hypothetical protein